MSLANEFSQRFNSASDKGAPVNLSWTFALRVEVALNALAKMLVCEGDHMTACERTMGATHPCTCGVNEARAVFGTLVGPSGGPYVPESSEKKR